MKRKSARKAPGDQRVEPIRTLSCHTCGRAIAGFESVHYGSVESGYRDLCLLNSIYTDQLSATDAVFYHAIRALLAHALARRDRAVIADPDRGYLERFCR